MNERLGTQLEPLYRQAGDAGSNLCTLRGHMRGEKHPTTAVRITYGEYQVDEHMHHHEADQDPVHPLGQLGLW